VAARIPPALVPTTFPRDRGDEGELTTAEARPPLLRGDKGGAPPAAAPAPTAADDVAVASAAAVAAAAWDAFACSARSKELGKRCMKQKHASTASRRSTMYRESAS
jgi:hypothetical protein